MTEILTESFCERCGTRYTFESSAPRQRRMGGLKVLGRGLKNFVMSDDSSLDEALAAARSDAERDATAHQLDAFHRTFNFCMSCRQYTCANCWNEVEARCLSCAPLAFAEAAPTLEEVDPERLLRFMGAPAAEAPAAIDEPAAAHRHVAELIGDEVHEAEVAVAAEVAAEAAAAMAEAEAAEAPAEPDEIVAAEEPTEFAGLEPEATPTPEAAHAVFVVPTTAKGGFEPGQNIDDAIAAYEAKLDGEALAAADEPVATSEATLEPAPEAQAEPLAASAPEAVTEPAAASAFEPAAVEASIEIAAELEPAELEPAELEAATPESPVEPAVQPAPELLPAAATAPIIESAPVAEEPPPGTPGVDVIEQPTWPAAASPASAPTQPPSPAQPPAAPSWPTGPRWPTSLPARPAPTPTEPSADPLAAFMARTATDAMWAASSRDVVQPAAAAAQATAAVQPCTNCGISLSATARFCRRCGTPQG